MSQKWDARLIWVKALSTSVVGLWSSPLFARFSVCPRFIRIFHGCEVGIEKSVQGSLFGMTRLCRVMPNNDPEGRIFLSVPNRHDWFFVLHIFWPPVEFYVGVAINESRPYTSQELDVIIFLFFLGLVLLRFCKNRRTDTVQLLKQFLSENNGKHSVFMVMVMSLWSTILSFIFLHNTLVASDRLHWKKSVYFPKHLLHSCWISRHVVWTRSELQLAISLVKIW